MESYVGLDVSLKRTSICVVGRTGKVLCEGTVNSAPEAIVGFVKSKAAGAVRIVAGSGMTLTLVAEDGTGFFFDVASRRFVTPGPKSPVERSSPS